MTQATPPVSSTIHAGTVVRMMVGPVVYAVYFGVVYLFVEAACNAGPGSGQVLGGRTINTVVLVATLATSVILALWTVAAFAGWWRLRRADRASAPELPHNRSFYALVGFMLSLLFTLVTLATGVPALVLDACAWA